MQLIEIDSTELGAAYIDYLESSNDVEVQLKCLPVGDIVINGLGIERKTVNDFFLTLQEGRLFEQLRRLKFAYTRQLLLIEGKGMRYHLDKEPWFGLYIRLTAGWQIPILHTQDAEQTATCIHRICRQDEVAPAGPIRPRPRNPAYGARGTALRMLLEIRGIGGTHAAALLRHFGTISALFAASEEELTEVPGIGPTRAAAIREANGGGGGDLRGS